MELGYILPVRHLISISSLSAFFALFAVFGYIHAEEIIRDADDIHARAEIVFLKAEALRAEAAALRVEAEAALVEAQRVCVCGQLASWTFAVDWRRERQIRDGIPSAVPDGWLLLPSPREVATD